MGKKLLSSVNYRASLHLVQGDQRSSRDGQNGGDCSKKLSAKKYRASLFKALVEGSSSKKDKKPDNKLKRPNESQQAGIEAMELKGELTPCSNTVKRQRKGVHDKSGLPANTEISSSRELEKEICGVAPIVRCPLIGKNSESCIQKDGTEQDIHVEEVYQPVLPDKTDNPVPPEVEEDGGCPRASCCMDVQPARIHNAIPQVYGRGQSVILSGQQELQREIKGIPHSQNCSDKDVFTKQQTTDSEEANKSPNSEFIFTKQTSDSEEASGSPDNEVASTKQQVRDSEEATISLSTDISKSINLVETIYSKRKEKLLANQLKKSIQFKEERDRIEKESIAKLRKEHLHESACVGKMHLQSEVRLVELRIVDQEFIRKVQIIRNHLDTKQEKLDSMHKAARKEEKVLKCHWLQEAKSGKPVDAFLILPQLSNSCFNLEGLKHCEQVHSEELISDGTVPLGLCEMGIAGPSEVVRGDSPLPEGTIPTEPPDNSFNSSFYITDPLPYNQPNDDVSAIPPDVQLQRHWPTILPSEPPGPLLSILSNYEKQVFPQADQLQVSTTANSPSEPLLLNSSSSGTSVFPHALQLELSTAMDSVSVLVQSNESEQNISLDVQLQRPLPTDPHSEPGSGTPVSENSMLCHWAKVNNHVQFLKFDEEFTSICRVVRAQPVKLHDELHTHEPPQTENDRERRATMSGESLAHRRRSDREAQDQTEMEAKDCRSIQVQQHSEQEQQVRLDRESQQPHHCDTLAPQPPNYQEREEKQKFTSSEGKAIDGERRAIAQRKHHEREAEQARQRKRRERESEQARQCAEMTVAQRKRREREEQAHQSAEMGAQQAKNIQQRTTTISRRSLAQRPRREREAHGREMGAKKKKAINTSFNRVIGSLGSLQGAHLGPLQNHQLFESFCHRNSDRPLMVPAAATTTITSTSTAIQSPEQVVQHSPAIFSSNRPFSCSRGPIVNYQVGSVDSSDLLGEVEQEVICMVSDGQLLKGSAVREKENKHASNHNNTAKITLAQRRRRKRESHGREMGDGRKKQSTQVFTGSLGSLQGAHLGLLQNHQLFGSSCNQNSDRPLMVPAAATTTLTSTSTATQSPEKVVQHSPEIFSSNRPFSCSRGPTVNYQVGSLDSSDLLGGRTRSDLHGPATTPLLTCLTANIYDIPHSVYSRRK
ncbi:hypothetical protein MKW98_022654 [Papaver atlanticum]|uniref:Uncharacterized protein n=1 Tax=Papaver atlanticum TaxID=357466 RepID=A0AAD4T469_9MAGN|nr:hypothetical protein MKW98_022654 [Papaver atlanticum]